LIGNDKSFLAGVNTLCEKWRIRPADLLGLMCSESELNPKARNAGSGATGLIQWIPSTARGLGVTTDALYGMSRTQQLKYVDKYFTSVGLPKGSKAGHLYCAVFLPAFVKERGGYVVAKRGGGAGMPASWYSANSGLDMNNDGRITIDELGERVRKKQKEFGIS
jgi:hypothetical protein